MKSSQSDLKQRFNLDNETAKIFLEKRDSITGKTTTDLKAELPAQTYNSVVKSREELSEQSTAELGKKYDLKNVKPSDTRATRPIAAATF